jgi:hypothetical protein
LKKLSDMSIRPGGGRGRHKAWPLVVASCVWALLLLPIAFVSLMMAVQQVGFGSSAAIVGDLFLVWPVVLVLAVAVAWLVFRLDRLKTAWMFMAGPAVWPLVPLAAWAILLPHSFFA